MTRDEKLSIGRWYLKQCASGWSGGPSNWLIEDPPALITATYYYIHSHQCLTCGSRAEEAYHTDADWHLPNNYTNGKHHHYQCSKGHSWCPITGETDDYRRA